MKEANPEAKFGDIAKIISTHFKALPTEERAYWDNKAAEDKARCEFAGCEVSQSNFRSILPLIFCRPAAAAELQGDRPFLGGVSDSLFVLLRQKDFKVGGLYTCGTVPFYLIENGKNVCDDP